MTEIVAMLLTDMRREESLRDLDSMDAQWGIEELNIPDEGGVECTITQQEQ